MNRFPPRRGRHVCSNSHRTRLRVETLGDRVTPAVVVNGTGGDDVISGRLVQDEWGDPRAVEVLVNGVVQATVRVVTSFSEPATTYYLAQAVKVNGGAGDDQIELGDLGSWTGGYITLTGGLGNDTLVGGNGPDSLVGGPGADDLSGGLGSDTLQADTDDVRLVGGGDGDSLVMTGIRGTVAVTLSTLTINGRTLSEADGTYSRFATVHLSGAGTDDTLTATGLSKVSLAGGGGNDRLQADASAEVELHGGAGNDTLNGTGLVRGRLLGDGGDDRLEINGSPVGLVGGDGNDTLLGGSGVDGLYGGPGDDVLDGGEDQFVSDFAANRLYGGPGNDVLYGGSKANVLVGGRGNDRLVGGALADRMYGEQGDDSLSGGDGNDQLSGDGPEPPLFPYPLLGVRKFTYIGADDLDGGAGDDNVSGDRADTRLEGGAGRDSGGAERIRGRAVLTDTSLTINGRAVAFGGFESFFLGGSQATDDVLDARGFGGFVNLSGLGGNDTLLAGSGGSRLSGGRGADALEGGADDDDLHADVYDRRLLGGGGLDRVELYLVNGTAVLTDTSLRINGRSVTFGGFEDALLAAVGESYGLPQTNDRLDASGFSGSVDLVGGPGNDTLTAGSGGSELSGQDGSDVLIGGAGNDVVEADLNDRQVIGGGGTDTVSVHRVRGTVVLTDTALTVNGAAIDTMDIAGFEAVALYGSDWDDTLDASAFTGPVTLYGGGGNDLLVGGVAADDLLGSWGDDTLDGGAGSDTLWGSYGADTFVPDEDPFIAAEEQARSDYSPAEGDTGY